MKKLIYIFGLVLAIVNISCEDQLEKLPSTKIEDSEVFGSTGGLVTATLGNYAYLKKENFIKVNHFVGEYAGDNIALSGTTTDNLMYIYNYQHQPDDGRASSFWAESFKLIISANKIIGAITEGDDAEMDNLLGENYYLRAYVYFSLCNAFGRPYNQSPESNLGVPLKLDADVNNYPKRATVKAIYDQIVLDLKKAETLLTISKENVYANKEAAQALLSRVYLYMEDYEQSKTYSNKVITSGKYTLLSNANFKKYNTFKPEENSETIFAVRMTKDKDFPYAAYPGWEGYGTIGGMYANIDGRGWGEMYASLPYRELLAENPDDARAVFIDPQYEDPKEDGTVRMWAIYVEQYHDATVNVDKQMFKTIEVKDTVVAGENKYKLMGVTPLTYVSSDAGGNFVNVNIKANGREEIVNAGAEKRYVKVEKMMKTRQGYPKYFVTKCSKQEGQHHLWSPVVSRLAEMYLNRAECLAEQGDPAGAIADVNKLRVRAGIPEYDPANLPVGKTALDLVLKERRLELAYEGHRKFDIFRKGKTLNRLYPGTHDRGSGVRMSIAPTDPRVITFIPQSEIDAYPVPLTQNP